MKNIFQFFILFSILFSPFQGIVSAQERNEVIIKAKASQLIDNAKLYDGQQVEISGELIGDVMIRGSYAWISILDEGTAISAWIQKSKLPSDINIGRYEKTGDIVRLQGIFHRACQEHGGDLDIHAETLALVSKGAPVNHPIDKGMILISLTLLAMGVILTLAWRRRERNGQ
jgi:hypothetical protein